MYQTVKDNNTLERRIERFIKVSLKHIRSTLMGGIFGIKSKK